MKSTSVQAVKDKTKQFLSDRKNANNLIEIISLSEDEKDEVVLACIRSIHKIFSLLIVQKDLYLEQDLAAGSEDNAGPEEKFRIWLRERYADAHERLKELVCHHNQHVQELSLCTIMKLMESEGNTPITKVSSKEIALPVTKFEDLLSTLLSSENDMTDLIARFQEYLEFDDVRYISLNYCYNLLKEKMDQEFNDVFVENLLSLLELLSVPKTESTKLNKFLVKLADCECKMATKMQNAADHRKMFSKVWTEFLRHKLSTRLYKKILVNLHEKVIPGMSNPLLLGDFLTASYSIGGAISLLALNGLFILVNFYNLEYPDFYNKLYALFEPSIFHVKYRARFFYLADLFLTSTHLPGYLVAAFIKRLSRLALTAPPSGLEIIIPFVYNLLIRHPNCTVLIHNPDVPKNLTSDPYKMEEPDPAKSNALQSSLWEIKTLQQHYHHFLARKANQVSRKMQPEETKLGELLEMKTSDMFQKEVKNKIKEMPVTFNEPKGIFKATDDQFSDLWTLE